MFIHEFWLKFEPVGMIWHYILAAIYTLVTIIAIIANAMVLYYLIVVKKNTSCASSSYFLISLALSDLLKVIIALPLSAASSFYGSWIFGELGCTFYAWTSGMFGYVNIVNLAIMSFERYMIMRDTMQTYQAFNPKIKITCIALIWIYSAALISTQFITPHGFILEGFLTSCSFDYLSHDLLSRISNITQFVFGFFLPLLFIAVFYVLTKKNLDRRSVRMCNRLSGGVNRKKAFFKSALKANRSQGSEQDQSALPSMPQSNSDGELSRQPSSRATFKSVQSQRNNFSSILRRETRTMKTILLNVGMFLVAWLPYSIMVLCAQFGPSFEYFLNPYTASLPAVFAKISSVYNPIIYTLSNRECQIYFRRLFKSRN